LAYAETGDGYHAIVGDSLILVPFHRDLFDDIILKILMNITWIVTSDHVDAQRHIADVAQGRSRSMVDPIAVAVIAAVAEAPALAPGFKEAFIGLNSVTALLERNP
jgi:hypothetical protein